ncbi:MAG: hypothetical protein LBP39_00510 [Rickettsiales bacterium]|jgi:hypothetical protein|nr:hypothetical protein [Rickettsiales bacterium]
MSNLGTFIVTAHWQSLEEILGATPTGVYTIQNKGNYSIILSEMAAEPEESDHSGVSLYPHEKTVYDASGDPLWLRIEKFGLVGVEINVEGSG